MPEAGGIGADHLFAQLKNPYFLSDNAALTQTLGWTNAWVTRASLAAVEAESAADIALAVNFARERGIRLVVKGGGHSYFGNSNAANSLLIWTRRMDRVELLEGFRPAGAPSSIEPVAAINIGLAPYGDASTPKRQPTDAMFREVDVSRSVVAGFVQGGGFGSFSKQFGTGAANLLEAEIVTADGQIRIASACRDRELFFGLRGGGGGTFGVVTRLTLKTYPLPDSVGAVLFRITASTDAAWRALVDRVIDFYATSLFNPSWGEQIRFLPVDAWMYRCFVMAWQGGDRGCLEAVLQLDAGAKDRLRFPRAAHNLVHPRQSLLQSEITRDIPAWSRSMIGRELRTRTSSGKQIAERLASSSTPIVPCGFQRNCCPSSGGHS